MSKLAINGGQPVRTKKWLDNNTIGEEEIEVVSKILRDGKISGFEGSYFPNPNFSFFGGEYVLKLEKKWAEAYGVKYCSTFNSATSSIMAALAALEVGYGDEVIVSCSTMTACAPLPLYFGAIPIFADIEEETGSICPESLKKYITKRTKVIILVHQYGNPAKLEEIQKIAKDNDIYIIEDCAQAYKAKFKDIKVGTIGDVGIFSLNINKTIHSGEGGVCITNNLDLHQRMILFRNHGENVIEHMLPDKTDMPNMIGLNLRLTELQAGIAICQLDKLHRLHDERQALVDHLIEGLEKFNFLSIIKGTVSNTNVFYQFPILFHEEKMNRTVEEFVSALKAEGIYLLRGHRPLYHQPIYQNKSPFKHGYPYSAKENQSIVTNYDSINFPVAEKHSRNLIILGYIRPPQTILDMDDIIQSFLKVSEL